MKPHFALAFASTLAMAACATPATDPASGMEGGSDSASCDADAAASAIGKAGTQDVLEQARVAAGAEVARFLKPGQVVTMEYRPGRLNLHVDEDNVVTRVLCG